MSPFSGDFQFAVRMLFKTPGPTLVAVLALGLGIGGNIGSFINVNALVLNPLPYPNLERIMTVWETVPKLQNERTAVAPANFLDWKEQSNAFDEMAAYRQGIVNLTGREDSQPILGCFVSHGFLELLGMNPDKGRTFAESETEEGRDRVVVLSQAFWRDRLAGDSDVLNRDLLLSGRNYKVIGVMPADFDFPLATEVWIPLTLTPEEKVDRASHTLLVLGRLKQESSTGEARAAMNTIAQRLQQQFPLTNEARGVIITPVRELTNLVTDRFVIILFGASAFVLLLAAVNVANLQLARANARQKSVAIQAALGASRLQLARPLLAEGIVLGITGGAVGLLMAGWNLDLVRSMVPAQVFQWVAGLKDLRIDSSVLLFALLTSILTGVLCSIPAVVQLLRRSDTTSLYLNLSGGECAASDRPLKGVLGSALVVSQIAMALVLLVGAGLMVNTFRRMAVITPGYNPQNVLTMQVSLAATGYRETDEIVEFYERVLSELRSIPGVKSAGANLYSGRAEGFVIEGRPEPGPGEPRPNFRIIDEQYLQTLEIPVLRGRSISSQDGPESPPVVVISEAIARHYWPDSDPIGRRVKLGNSESPWLTVAGVSGDTKDWFTNEPVPAAYVPFRQSPQRSMRLVMRTAGEPSSIAPAARARIREIDRAEPIHNVKSLEQILSEQTSGVRTAAVSMSMFAVTALLLALTGVYAVMSYSVVQRIREIGIRTALGATKTDVLTMTLAQAVRMATAGLAIGVPAGYLIMRIMSAALYGLVVVDWITFSTFAFLLVLFTLLAAYIPARRATAIDPSVALRHG
ncbi:MAG: ABC transporter permease [Acidobacteria bacterium]|nr:ABC transporter permease [Acidobacteriota bacterium]